VLLRSRMAFSLLAFGAMDSGMGRSSPPSPPTFLGYHWPIHTETKYQLHWRVQEMHPGVGTSTTSWDPQVIIRTGTIQPEGLAVVMDIQAAAYATTGEGNMTASPAMTLEAMSVLAVLTPQGHWEDVQWSVLTNPMTPRSVLTAMLRLSDLLPSIPVDGWAAGKPTDASFPAATLNIAGLHMEPRTPGAQKCTSYRRSRTVTGPFIRRLASLAIFLFSSKGHRLPAIPRDSTPGR